MSIHTSIEFIDIMSDLLAIELIKADAEERERWRSDKWWEFAVKTEKQEEAFKPKIRPLFTKQEKSVLSAMRRIPIPEIGKAASDEAVDASVGYVDEIFKPAAWQVPFEAMALPLVTASFAAAGQDALAEVGIETAFNVTNPRARRILENRVFKFAKEVNETTQDRLRRTLAIGFDKGEDIRALSQRVADQFDIARGSRTNTIARTEVIGASNQGTFEGYTQSQIVETIIWLSARLPSTRDSHLRVDGQEVKLGERFSNGLRYPHDPAGPAEEVINCVCTHAAGKLKKAA